MKSQDFNWPQKGGGGGQGPWALTSNLATNWSQPPTQLAKLSLTKSMKYQAGKKSGYFPEQVTTN